jgi:hypothetical protein
MTRVVSVSALLVVVGVAIGACNGIYTPPARGISADIAASGASGSAGLSRNQTPDFRDTDLSARR